MEGYFTRESKGKGKAVPTGELRIAVTNIGEFEELIEKARKEARQLEHTLEELYRFDIRIDFDSGSNHDSSETAFPR